MIILLILIGFGVGEIFVYKNVFRSGPEKGKVPSAGEENRNWVKRFGGPGVDSARSIQRTMDNGYIIAGSTDYGKRQLKKVGISFDDVYLLKIDADGNKVWEKTFRWEEYNSNGHDIAYSVQQTLDNGYILAGATRSEESSVDVLLIKTSSIGEMLWQKKFGENTYDEIAFSVRQTSDNGFIIAGRTIDLFNPDPENRGGDAYLIKTDENGNKLWEKTFGGKGHDQLFSVQQTLDNGYILAGETTSFGNENPYGEEGKQDVYLVKTDDLGNKVWEKTFGNNEWDMDSARAVAQTLEGGYIVAGGTFSRARHGLICQQCVYLVKVDVDGNKVWDNILGKKFGSSYAHAIQQTPDGKFIVAGGAGPPFETGQSTGGDAFLLRLDANGNTIWEKLFGGLPDEGAYSIQQALDGGYVMAGEINYLRELPEGEMFYRKETIEGIVPDINGTFIRNILPESDVYIIKTDELGNTEEMGDFGGNVGDPVIESETVIAETEKSKLVMRVVVYNLGDEFGIGGKYVIAHSIADYIEPNESMQPKSGNKYVIVDISAMNYGPPVSVNISDFTIEDDKGNSYTTINTSNKPVFFTGILSQYRINRGYISYEVPKDVSGLKLLIYNSGEAIVKVNLDK